MFTILTHELMVLNDTTAENIFRKEWEKYLQTSPALVGERDRYWISQTASLLINTYFKQVVIQIVETANLYNDPLMQYNFSDLSKLSYECYDYVNNLTIDFDDYVTEPLKPNMAVPESDRAALEDEMVNFAYSLIDFLYSEEMFRDLAMQFSGLLARMLELKQQLGIIHFWYDWWSYEDKLWNSEAPLWAVMESDVVARIYPTNLLEARELDSQHDENGFWTWTDILGQKRTLFSLDENTIGDFELRKPFLTVISPEALKRTQ